jgi:hypothetical protein
MKTSSLRDDSGREFEMAIRNSGAKDGGLGSNRPTRDKPLIPNRCTLKFSPDQSFPRGPAGSQFTGARKAEIVKLVFDDPMNQ